MNTILDLAIYTETVDSELDDIFDRFNLFMTESFNEYNINIKEAIYKVATESGTEDDLTFLYEAAGNGLIEKVKKAVVKIIESIKKGIIKIKTSINNFFENKKTKDALTDAAKVAAKNPKMKNTKITIIDADKSIKELNKLEAKVDKKIALFNKGKFSEKDKNDLDEVEEGISKVKIAVTSTVAVVSVAVAIKLIYDWRKKSDEATLEIPDMSKLDAEMTPAETMEVSRAISMKGLIQKEKISVLRSAITNALSDIKTAFTGVGEIEDVSIDENISLKEVKAGMKTESYLDDMIKYLNIEEAMEEVDDLEDSAKAYLESLEAELFTEADDEEIDEMYEESEDDDLLTEAVDYLESLYESIIQ